MAQGGNDELGGESQKLQTEGELDDMFSAEWERASEPLPLLERLKMMNRIDLFEECLKVATSNKKHTVLHHWYSSDMHCTWDELDWYREAHASQKFRLKNFLMEIDRQNRVDPEGNTTKDIHKAVHQIITALAGKIEQLEPRLGGKLFGVGSSHNQTKLGEPDEFDFIYELNTPNLLRDESAWTSFSSKEEGLQIHARDLSQENNLFDLIEVINYQLTSDFIPSPYFLYANLTKGESDQLTFNYQHIQFALFMVLDNALQQLDLPVGWSHGGFDRPRYSGVRFRFPSFLIQLYYEGTDTHRPLSVDVDFVPVLKVDSQSHHTEGVLEDYLQSMAEVSWVHLTDVHPPYTGSEDKLLSNYHFESIAKTLIRVCKMLCREGGLSSPRYLRRDLVNILPQYGGTMANCDPGDWSFYVALTNEAPLFAIEYDDDTLATGQDIGENLGSSDYVSSYVIKMSVLTLIALDPSKGKLWTSDDIVDLVLSVFMIINDLIVSGASYKHKTDCYQNVSVQLQRYFKTPCDAVIQGTSTSRQAQPKPYLDFRRALENGNCQKLKSLLFRNRYGERLDRIFVILKSALNGKSTAEFKILLNDQSHKLAKENSLMTKDELKKMVSSSK